MSLENGFLPDDIRATIIGKIESLDAKLREISLSIHDHPELGWKETHAHDLLVSVMREQLGFQVTPHAYGLKTGFEAVFQHKEGGRTIGFNSEYDALPVVGHACGHNLIAIGGIAAAVACAEALKQHDIPGRVVLLGTPAEETEGGKVNMIKAGAYKQLDICLMIHPTPTDALLPMLAMAEVDCDYTGQGAHAAMAPWQGVNALDAAVTAYTAISALRQQTYPTSRIHAIIEMPEGSPVNIIPQHCRIKCAIRSVENKQLEVLKERLQGCLQAGASGSGCKADINWTCSTKDLRNNVALGDGYIVAMAELGVNVIVGHDALGSTDFGDVSYEVPALHPMYMIPPTGAGGGNHTADFTTSAGTQGAHDNTLKAAKGIALTAIRAVKDDEYYQQIRGAFDQDKIDRVK